MIPKVEEAGEYKLSGRTLNALIDAANAWENLRVELVVSSADVTRLIRGSAGSTLHIVVPPVGGGSLPPGGTVGQMLTKQSSTDGDADWETPSAAGVAYRELTHSITVSGVVPTVTEINTALVATYTDPDPDLVPADGDFIRLTVSGTPRFVARVTTQTLAASGIFVRSFVVNSVTYYATLHQCGLY